MMAILKGGRSHVASKCILVSLSSRVGGAGSLGTRAAVKAAPNLQGYPNLVLALTCIAATCDPNAVIRPVDDPSAETAGSRTSFASPRSGETREKEAVEGGWTA